MRYLLLALLIALMPLRGWAGDAMATQMAAVAVVQQSMVAQAAAEHSDAAGAQAHDHVVSGPASTPTAASDCAGHTSLQTSSASDNSNCHTCVVCQTCHSVALLLPAFAGGAKPFAAVAPQSAAPSFTSAERALRLKPPIS